MFPHSAPFTCEIVPQVPSRSRSLQCSCSFYGHTVTSQASRPLIPPRHLYFYPVLSGNLERFETYVVCIHRAHVRIGTYTHMSVCEAKSRLGACGYSLVAHAGPVPLDLGLLSCDCGRGPLVLLQLGREVLPLAPAVKVNECLHAAPLHDLALEPDEVDGLRANSTSAYTQLKSTLGHCGSPLGMKRERDNVPWSRSHYTPPPAPRDGRSAASWR